MADFQADGRLGVPANGHSFGTMANIAGAAVSLALVLGIGIWGYNLVMRDVSGVPVVRAAEGPMRVQPDNPGGALAANQGLAVNQVAAVGVAEGPADRLVLAPRPVTLRAEDDPAAKLNLIKLKDAAQPEPAVAQGPAGTLSVEDLVQQLTADAKPLTKVAAVVEPAPEQAAVEPEAVVKKPKLGLVRSLRPKLRPAAGRRVASVDPVAVVAATGIDVDPATLPPGTRLAQLGAYESAAIARKEWDRLGARFDEFLEGKKRVIQKAQSGGRTFYRLRAHGFADISEARRFCSALVAERAECIPVTTK